MFSQNSRTSTTVLGATLTILAKLPELQLETRDSIKLLILEGKNCSENKTLSPSDRSQSNLFAEVSDSANSLPAELTIPKGKIWGPDGGSVTVGSVRANFTESHTSKLEASALNEGCRVHKAIIHDITQRLDRLVMKINFIKIIVSVRTLLWISALLLCFSLQIGCSTKLKAYPSLSNQGVLPLSPTNSYLGTNLFLGNEAGRSRILYQFLKGRGAPGAIEIVEKDFQPAKLFMFYPKQVQVYIAELSSAKNHYEWIIRGPYNIARNDFRKLVAIEKSPYEAAPIIINGEIERFVAEPPKPVAVPVQAEVRRTPPPAPKKKKPIIKVVKPKIEEQSDVKTVVDPLSVKTSTEIPTGPGLNSDQQAIRISKGLTELTAEGDLLHSVKVAGESLDSIAKWYTGDTAQAKAIAEFNSLPADATLPRGAKLKIPKALAKTEQRMQQ